MILFFLFMFHIISSFSSILNINLDTEIYLLEYYGIVS